jgi:hypothetical protein
MKWVNIEFNPCFIVKRTDKAVRIRLPKWVEGVVGSFWLPAGCVKDFETRLAIPEDLHLELNFKKADDFGVFGEWQQKTVSPEWLKTRVFEVDGHKPIQGDTRFVIEAPELTPVTIEPLKELLDL